MNKLFVPIICLLLCCSNGWCETGEVTAIKTNQMITTRNNRYVVYDSARAWTIESNQYKWVITEEDVSKMSKDEIRDFSMFLILFISLENSTHKLSDAICQRLEDLAMRMLPARCRVKLNTEDKVE